jgi:hypothetical protein
MSARSTLLLPLVFMHASIATAGPKNPTQGWTVQPSISALGERVGTRATVRSVDGTAQLIALRLQNGDYAVAVVFKRDRPHCPRLCEVRFRFDEEPSIPYDAAVSSDGAGDTIVFSPAIGLFSYFENAGRVRIAVPVAGKGITALDFITAPGLRPDPEK